MDMAQLRDKIESDTRIDLFFPLLNSIGARGTDASHHHVDPVFAHRNMTRFSAIYPHNLTHLHLPWTLNWELYREELDNGLLDSTIKKLDITPPPHKFSPESWDVVLKRAQPRILECVILNCFDKKTASLSKEA